EPGPAGWRVLGGGVAPHGAGQLPDDGEAEPGPGPGARRWARAAVEALEAVGALGGRDARPVVLDRQQRPVAADAHLDVQPGLGVAPGVVHEVGADLGEPVGVPRDEERPRATT